MTQSAQPQSPNDLKPFTIDPLFLGTASKVGLSVSWFTALSMGATVVLTTWAAAISGSFESRVEPRSFGESLKSFLLQSRTASFTEISYLNDVSSVVMTFSIPASLSLVYALFHYSSALHSSMYASGCMRFTGTGLKDFNAEVDALNDQFRRAGKRLPLILPACFGVAALINWRQQGHLYQFLGSTDYYSGWWASLSPLRPGGVLWSIMGALGIYAVYVEAVLGLKYRSFLSRCRSTYIFRANSTNPDGYYGWAQLRAIVTNLEIGLIATGVSSWAMFYFLLPGVGIWLTMLMLSFFIGMVSFVFFGVNSNYRRQAQDDRAEQILRLGAEADQLASGQSVEEILKAGVYYQRIAMMRDLPAAPIRRSWFIAGVLTASIPFAALVLQLLQYLLDLNR